MRTMQLLSAIASILKKLSGYRTYLTCGTIIAVGSIPPAQQVVYGSFDLTLEMWQLIEQATVPLFGLAIVFVRMAISKLPAALSSLIMPLVEAKMEELRQWLLEQIKPKDDLNFPTAASVKTMREIELEDLLTSARAIAERKGDDTAWERFSERAAQLGIGSVTAKVFRKLPDDPPDISNLNNITL